MHKGIYTCITVQSYKHILVHMYTMSALISMYHMQCILNAFEALMKNDNVFILEENFRKKSLIEISWNKNNKNN